MVRQQIVKGKPQQKPKKPEKSKPPTMADLKKQVKKAEAALAEIEQQQRKCRKSEAEFEMRKLAAKAAKEIWEADQAFLGGLIEEIHQPNLFKQEKPKDDGIGKADAWRLMPCSELKLRPGTEKALREGAGFGSLGDLTAYLDKYKLTDIKGIGEAAALEIDQQFLEFWKRHPEFCLKDDPPVKIGKPITEGHCSFCGVPIDSKMIAGGGPCRDSAQDLFCKPAHRDKQEQKRLQQKKADKAHSVATDKNLHRKAQDIALNEASKSKGAPQLSLIGVSE